MANQVVIMAKADIAQKQEREREEWKLRGVAGQVSALNPAKKEITIMVASAEGPRPIIVTERQGARIRRYSAGSVKFSDAKPSTFDELKVGDQVRALGDKSSDGKRLAAEEIVTGAFRTVGGTVLEVIPQRREVKIAQLSNKQELTILITRETMIRRITPQLANIIANGGEAEKSSDPKRAKGPVELQGLLEKTPPMPPQEIRPGDVVIVSSTQGADPNRVTAIAYLTGLDVLLSVLQGKKPPADSAGLRNVDTGLPMGVLEFGIGLP
jgi:transcription antitermination factor NusG